MLTALPAPMTETALADKRVLDLFTTLIPDPYECDPMYRAFYTLGRDYAQRVGIEDEEVFAHGVAAGMTACQHTLFKTGFVRS